MTPQDIQMAKELCAKATRGVWSWERDRGFSCETQTVYAGRDSHFHGLNLFGRLIGDMNVANNLDFICEARALLPKALAHLEGLQNTTTGGSFNTAAQSSSVEMTHADYQRARELCAKATGDVWTWESESSTSQKVYAGRTSQTHGANLFGVVEGDANGANNLNFVCQSRVLLPRVLDAIAVLQPEWVTSAQVSLRTAQPFGMKP